MEGKEKSNGVANTALGLSIGSLGLLGLQNGMFGGLFGGNRPPMELPATQRDVSYERQLTEKDMKIAQLEAEKYTDNAVLACERRLTDKIDTLKDQVNTMNQTQAVLNAHQSDALQLLKGETFEVKSIFAPYIKQPVMAASEAVATTFKTTPAAATAGN